MSIPAQASPASPALSALGCPFEGPEKLLEIWFAPSPDELPSSHEQPGLRLRPTKGKGREAEWQGLRRVGREVWEEMLDIVKCKVLSYVEGADLDAYLLR
jgi:S-adenosylmethionine decarboxylase